jgi:hypothetical protein
VLLELIQVDIAAVVVIHLLDQRLRHLVAVELAVTVPVHVGEGVFGLHVMFGRLVVFLELVEVDIAARVVIEVVNHVLRNFR